ncbi:hypothetical protein OHA72_01330 [Dactylosporangium sp. NBC_01737]|uniref:hypothetical protein n=1 Tax=Dactylosporangium sp. NBC_01737 TaxID=2975959 RepID=UPI002E0FD9B0|nr:hypothetical protein OHA72_01330 [Dactylosporangium sp. NBC_01737]
MGLVLHPDGPSDVDLCRLAIAAALTDAELVHLYKDETVHSELLTATTFASYANEVWAGENHHIRLSVHVIEELDPAIAAVFSTTDANGLWYLGQPFLYVKAGQQRKLTALHEVAHLVVDSDEGNYGHSADWLSVYQRLQGTYLPKSVGDEWSTRHTRRLERIAREVDRDPTYIPPAILELPH